MRSSHSRSSRRWIAVASVVAVGVIGWMFSRVLRGAEVDAASASVASPGDVSDTSVADLDHVAGSTAAERARVAESASSNALASTTDAAPVGPTLELRALRTASFESIPGVEFAYACTPADAPAPEHFWTWFMEGELETRIADRRKVAVADVEGRARIPIPPAGFVVIASAPGWWGMTTIESDPPPTIEITLHREREIAVVVVDGAGQPLGNVPVALRASYWGNANDRVRARTGAADGIAHLRHVESIFDQGSAQEWTVGLAVALVKPISAPIEPQKLPTEPVRLVMPQTGSCEVRLLDETGELSKDPFDVTLAASLPSTGDERERRRGNEREGATCYDVRDGVAVFPFVELGAEVFASARREGHWTSHTARGMGPKRAGEKAEVTLRLGTDVTTLVARLVDSAGAPIARRQVEVGLRVTGRREYRQMLGNPRTDENGSFRLDTNTRGNTQAGNTMVVKLESPRSGDLAQGSRDLPSPLPKGTYDLGDIVVEDLPAVFAGSVVDEAGTPAPQASINVRTHYVQDDNQPMEFGGADNWWAAARSDEQGHFEIRGKPTGDDFVLSAASGELRTVPFVARRGDQELVLRLTATGAITGRIVRDETAQGEMLTVQAARVGGEGGDGDENVQVASDGSFLMRRLLPGSYTLTLHDGMQWNELRQIPDVVVRANETTTDPRLDPLDLRGSHQVVHLTIVDDHGEPVKQGWFVRNFTDASGEEQQEYGPISNGKANVTHDGSGANVQIQAEGFCLLRLEKVIADQTVTLRRAPTVRIAVRPAPTLPGGAHLYVSLQPAASTDGEGGAWFDLDGNGEGQARMSGIGTMAVMFYVQVGGDENGTWQAVDGVDLKLDVVEAAGVQLFEIALDETKLAAAITQAQAQSQKQE
ncbi:MAG: hypothetical protein K8S98_06180 [Planctomycetes bacterium]|nr:hypothetical protein [Planctomycetota bacterium]